jgi:hypothetical protein
MLPSWKKSFDVEVEGRRKKERRKTFLLNGDKSVEGKGKK